jgi:hypothetical protein
MEGDEGLRIGVLQEILSIIWVTGIAKRSGVELVLEGKGITFESLRPFGDALLVAIDDDQLATFMARLSELQQLPGDFDTIGEQRISLL